LFEKKRRGCVKLEKEKEKRKRGATHPQKERKEGKGRISNRNDLSSRPKKKKSL